MILEINVNSCYNIKYIFLGVFDLDQKKIDRINELARKSKSEGLTETEKAEQTELRNEYRRAVTGNLAAQLESEIEKGNKIEPGRWYYFEPMTGMDHFDFCGTQDYPEGFEEFYFGMVNTANSR